MRTDAARRRVALGLAAASLAGCSLLFQFDSDSGERRVDAGLPDADVGPTVDAGRPDAAVDAGPCPDRPVEGRTHDDCLGCGTSCGPRRPFCCGASCCTDECGAPGNVCSTTPEEPLADGDADTDVDVDADADADADGCDHFTYEDCLGCGQPCSAHRPFCCGNTCCSEECGTVRNDCSADPLR